MLDEMGFASAANWFIEGYSRRTGIDITTEISPAAENLPSYLRLSLFRILQESLANVHRHSKSAKADVRVSVGPRDVSLTVKDFGRGIPAEKLDRFNKDGASVGVGLAGMKERVAELKGKFAVHSSDSGTQISATIPLIAEHELPANREATV
jgi:signal transduction histidine kinase